MDEDDRLESFFKQLQIMLKDFFSTIRNDSTFTFSTKFCEDMVTDDLTTPWTLPDSYSYLFHYDHLLEMDSTNPRQLHTNELNSTEIFKTSCDLKTLNPMPSKPYYVELAHVLCIWIRSTNQPIDFKPMNGLNETEDDTNRLRSLSSNLMALYWQWFGFSQDERKKELLEFLQQLGMRGVLTLFRIRKTKGSHDFLPPSPKQLLRSFNLIHNDKSKQTVGARALTKHFHRGEERWWGSSTGTHEEQNKQAVSVLMKVFQNAVWLNVHLLPHDVIVYEIRESQGYGARWIINNAAYENGLEFRGFLEPQMENGHENGWKH